MRMTLKNIFAPNVFPAARREPSRVYAAAQPRKRDQAAKKAIAPLKAVSCDWTSPVAARLDPYVKLTMVEYKTLNPDEAAFIIDVQDQLESTWKSLVYERKEKIKREAEVVAKTTEVHNLSRHLTGYRNKVATLENKLAHLSRELKSLSTYRKKLAALSQELEVLSERF